MFDLSEIKKTRPQGLNSKKDPTGFSTRASFQKLSGILLEGGGKDMLRTSECRPHSHHHTTSKVLAVYYVGKSLVAMRTHKLTTLSTCTYLTVYLLTTSADKPDCCCP